MTITNQINESLERIHFGEMQQYNGLTIWPLLGPDITDLNYDLLGEAYDRNEIHISENETPSVSEIRVKNNGETPVFGLDGEQLVGAKQNRILNMSMLFPQKTETLVPVSCVERGRWSGRDNFRVHEQMHHATGRVKRVRTVSDASRSNRTTASSQTEVWDDIRMKQRRMHSQSDSEDMAAFYRTNKPSLAGYNRAFRWETNQIGLIAEIQGLIGMELFDRANTLKLLHTKIMHGYAIDAIENNAYAAKTNETAIRLLRDLRSQTWLEKSSAGIGLDCRTSNSSCTGSALIAEGTCVHIGAWLTDTQIMN